MHPEPLARALATLLFFGALGSVVWLDHSDRQKGGSGPASRTALRMREVAKEVGLDFEHRPFDVDPKIANIAAHVAGLGASVALVDYDRDGDCDVYTTSSRAGSHNALFRNDGGRFEDVAGALGLADLNDAARGHSMGSIWADLDGDSDPECLLYRFGRPALLRNDGATFADVTAESGLDLWINAPGACFLDYDRDGRLDLYLAAYFREEVDLSRLATTTIMQDSFEFATNGGRDRLFRNEGGLRFRDVTEQVGLGGNRWTLAVSAPDLDGDGFCDLYLANDYGPEELFLNKGGERFELADVGLSERSKSGMSVAVGDVKNEGVPSVFVTNICRSGYLFQGNNLRWNRLAQEGRFVNEADERGVVDCGWAWGAQFGDLDNDGWQDLFVVNGFLSRNRERDYWFAMNKIAGGVDLFEDATVWVPLEDLSLSGYEPSRVLLNLDGAGFRDVAKKSGVDDLLDGRGVAFADLFGTGRLDAVVANLAGPLLLYRNETPQDGRHWIQFDLRGRGENTDAVGACVQLEFAGSRQCQFVLAGSGFASQNGHVLHFGLGADDAPARAIVRWPDGSEQAIEAPAVDRLHVVRAGEGAR